MNKHFIYALFDERQPNLIRYVGHTRSLSERLKEHFKESKRQKNYRADWIKKVIREGSSIGIRVLEECDAEIVKTREVFWIAKLKQEGQRLTNLTDGGDGVVNPGPEIKAKIGASWKDLLKRAHRVTAMSDAKKGKPRSALASQRIAEAKNTPESKAKRSRSAALAMNKPEVRQKLSQSLLGIKYPNRKSPKQKAVRSDEERKRMSERQRKTWAGYTPKQREDRIRGIRLSRQIKNAMQAVAATVDDLIAQTHAYLRGE
jgi:predicted GIY-YIG superfamily endonuclease